MTENDRQEALQAYLERVRPQFHRLFNLAHAITGNADRAEYSVREAMLECWTGGEAEAGSHGLRESLKRSTIFAALEGAREKPEEDWDGLEEIEGDALSAFIAQESLLTRRALALHYGCGFSTRRAAKVLGIKAKRVEVIVDRFAGRAARKLNIRNIEQALGRTVTAQLNRASAAEPEIAGVLRTFRTDAADLTVSRHLTARILRIAVTALLALICIAGFFLAAVLLQPEGTINTDADKTAIEMIEDEKE